ncbi:NAD-dependent deacetylase [Halogranum amylolyticum]|uniref:NAD-dependent deacetylase n=1 Tax=Halogranum amylolyticum TaxID=660520 RepID=A0A1H8T6W7_9EURY|nr:NAD-dependent protein deacylase [Halogranum amylolyticum]SEO86661.1 NAD-dependent deacetylase [Halogranum amylolyticum]
MVEVEDEIEALGDALLAADTAVAFTGAGVSTASGIPSFRGDDGVWRTRFDPDDFRVGRLDADPAGFWRDRLDLHEAMFAADPEPNAAHEALAELERRDLLDAVVTQNTDGLHAAAGTERLLELHGNAQRVVCRGCGRRSDAADARRRVREGECPPRCVECDGVLKPDVVLFGEMLPGETLQEAKRLARESDVFLAVGSSLTVEPAASLPGLAAGDGTLALVNFEETPYSSRAAVDLRADVTEVLPRIVERVDGQ